VTGTPRRIAGPLAHALALVAAPLAASPAITGIEASTIFDEPGETVIAEAPEEVVGFYCVVFSPDMRRVAYGAEKKRGSFVEQAVYLNDESSPYYTFVNCDQQIREGGLLALRTGVNSLTFSADGTRFAYMARKANEKWRFVLDGVEHEGVKSNYHFAPVGSDVAVQGCAGKEGCCWRSGALVGKPKGKGESCPASIEFTGKDGKAVPVSYEFEGGKKRLVIGGTGGPWYEEIRDLELSPGGKHHSYVGCRTKDECAAVVDGVESGPAYGRILDVVATGSGKPSLIAMTKAGFVVSHGGKEGPGYDYVTPPLVLDEAGRAFYLATLGEEKFAVIRQEGDGVEAGKTFPCIHMMRKETPAKLSATYPFAVEVPVLLSPDGGRFAFYACCNTCCRLAEAGCKKVGCHAEDADFETRVVVARNKPKGITESTSSKCHPPGSVDGFTWSPDGKRFAYVLTTGKTSQILVDNKVVVSRPGEKLTPPIFTPDGSTVVFVAWKDGKSGRTGRLHAGAGPVSDEYDYIEWPVALSADGKRAAFNAVKGRRFLLVVVDLAG
jgi:hypothetical protein